MKNFSLAKLFAALLICNIYIFVCAVSGTISYPTAEAQTDRDSDNSQDGDEGNNLGGTIDFIGENDVIDTGGLGELTTIELVNFGFAKPTFAQKPINSSYNPTLSVKELAGLVSSSSSTTTSTNAPIIVSMPDPEPVSEPVSEPASSSAPPEESGEPESSSSEDNSSSPEEPIIPNTPNPDAENEILRVKNGNYEESGKAIDIVSRIVQNEIGGSFAPEAIKAHAVATYTYVKYHNLHGNAPQCLLKDTASDSVRTLVGSVIGEAIYYDDTLIQAVYFASSAGGTLASKDVWGGDLPYLQRVYCELDEQYDPNYGKTTTFSSSDIKQRVYDKAGISLSGDPSDWFEIESRISGKYVDEMTIGGQSSFIDSDGTVRVITGRRFREIIMSYDIRSSAFDIDYDSTTDRFTIKTYGYGHGVGLSQHGANNLARYWGYDYKDILKFYFSGVEIY